MVVESFTPLGGLMAVLYVSTIGSILWWMLHVPKVGDISQHASRIQREQQRFARIVVPVQGDILSDRLVALASQMARFRGARMDLVYVVEIPLQFPISAISEETRHAADDTFARARKIAQKYDVKIEGHIEPARQAGPAIVRYATDTRADLVMMADTPKSNRRGTHYARSVEYVLENSPSEVIIDRPAFE